MSPLLSTRTGRAGAALAALLVVLNVTLIALLLAERASESESPAAATLPPTPTPVPNGAMWSLGTGGDGVNPYVEWVAVYPVSSLWNVLGAPSLRFSDQSPEDPSMDRSFEIGFYKYGPTWHTRNGIVEFWVGGPEDGGGTLSIIGNDTTGGQIEVRNPTDTGHISLDYRDAAHPMITVDDENALAIKATRGIVSESTHTFMQGIRIAPESERIGQTNGAAWDAGAITVEAAVDADSIVLITPITEPRGRWWVDDVAPGGGFTVRSSVPDEDMAFNWLVLN